MLMRLINFATGYGLVLFAAFLFVLTLIGPITAWGAEPTYLTVLTCAVDPLYPEKNVCETALRRPFPDRALCQKAVDLDGDGMPDQVWIDLVPRLLMLGQWAEIQCPRYIVP